MYINDERTGHSGRLRTSSPYKHLTRPDYWHIAKLCAMVRPFPNEIWLDIFKGLAKEGEYDTLERCRVACRGFHPIAKECLRGYLRFKSIEEVEHIKVDASGGEMRRWGGPLRVYIDGGNDEDGHRPIPHLATFASRLAGRWTCIMDLVITGAVCRARDLDLDAVFRDLAAFSITNLYLYDVIFPSILTLGRLVCALPSLKVLCLWNVQFAQHPRDASNISHFRLLPRTQLDTLVLGHRSDDTGLTPSFVDLVDLITAIGNRRCPVAPSNLAQAWSTATRQCHVSLGHNLRSPPVRPPGTRKPRITRIMRVRETWL